MEFLQWLIICVAALVTVIQAAPVEDGAVSDNVADQNNTVEIITLEEKNETYAEVVLTEDMVLGKSVNFFDVSAQSDFDPSKFAGTWYHMYRLKWSHHEYTSEVNSVALMDDGTIQTKSVYHDGEKCSEVITSVYTQSKNHSAMWTFGTYGGVSVLYTDYSQAVLLVCDEVGRDGICPASHVEVEVMARSTQPLNDQFKTKGIAVVEKLGLMPEDFEQINNEDVEHCKLEIEEKSCDISKYQVMEGFDQEMFSGLWHEVERTRANQYDTWQSGLLHFSFDDSFIYIQYTGTIDGKCMGPFKAYGPKQGTMNGGADMYLLVGSPDEHMFNPWNVHYHYKVLYTDGDVALTYSCTSEKDDGSCKDWAKQVSILSREHEISSETRSKLHAMVHERLCVDCTELEKVEIQEEHCELESEEEEEVETLSSGESGEGSGQASGQTDSEVILNTVAESDMKLTILPELDLEVLPEVDLEEQPEVKEEDSELKLAVLPEVEAAEAEEGLKLEVLPEVEVEAQPEVEPETEAEIEVLPEDDSPQVELEA